MVRTTFATPQLFETFDVRPILGRTFRDDENVHGGDLRKVVLGYGLWQDAFGGSSDVIGRQIQIRGRPHEVIGVLPPRFDYPDRTQVWMPLMSRYAITEVWWKRRDLYTHGVIARRRPDVTIAQAQADMDAIARRLAEEYPATNRDTRVRVRHLREAEVGQLGSQLAGVTAAAVLLFLLGCVNVSGLFVARAAGRAQEVAVRKALGAEPRRLMRQHVVEGLLYGLLGGVAGVAVAAAAIPALYALIPVDLPAWMQFRLDHRTLTFAASASVGTGLLISTTSLAWHLRPDLANVLRQGVKGGLETGLSSRLRRQLTVAQVALSVALLVGTGLTVRSLLQLGQVDTGTRTDGVLVASVAGDVVLSATREETIARHARGFRQMREALGTLPGVHTVTAATRIPFLNAPEERPVYDTTWHQADDGGIEFYFHHGQFPAETMRFLISTRNDPALLATSVRRTLESVNPNFVVERVAPFDRIAYEALWQRRLWTFLFLVFGTVAVVFTSVGLFAVMSYAFFGPRRLWRLPRVSTIGLDPLTRLARHQRRRDHVAADPTPLALSLQRIPARPGLVAARDGPGCDFLAPPPQAVQQSGLVSHRPDRELGRVRRQHRDLQLRLVRIDSHECDESPKRPGPPSSSPRPRSRSGRPAGSLRR